MIKGCQFILFLFSRIVGWYRPITHIGNHIAYNFDVLPAKVDRQFIIIYFFDLPDQPAIRDNNITARNRRQKRFMGFHSLILRPNDEKVKNQNY